MKCIENWAKVLGLFAGATLVCGALYTAVVTLVAQVAFPYQANGSFVEGSDGNRYSMLVGQSYSDEGHMWGRVQNYNAETFVGEDGSIRLWAGPSNISPASEDFESSVAERVAGSPRCSPRACRRYPVPSDLVTCSGSGFDPHISPAAAEYQVERLAKNTGKSRRRDSRDSLSANVQSAAVRHLGQMRR